MPSNSLLHPRLRESEFEFVSRTKLFDGDVQTDRKSFESSSTELALIRYYTDQFSSRPIDVASASDEEVGKTVFAVIHQEGEEQMAFPLSKAVDVEHLHTDIHNLWQMYQRQTQEEVEDGVLIPEEHEMA